MAPQTTVTGIDNHVGPVDDSDDKSRDSNQPNESYTDSKRKIGLGQRITNKINGFLETAFERLGRIVANNPWKTILISLICASLCALGLLEYSVENRGEKLWVSQSSVTLDYQDWIDETFPKKFRQISVMLDSGTNILTREGMLALHDIHLRITAIGNGTENSYENICYSPGNSSSCNPSSLIELWEFNRTKIQNLTDDGVIKTINQKPLISPVTRLPINVDLLVGGPTNTQNGKIESARVLRVYYRLKNREVFDSGKGLFVDEVAEEFEENFENEMSTGLPGYTVYYFSMWGNKDAASESASDDLQFFVIGYILVIIYLAVMLGSFSRLNHKVLLGFGGIGVIGISIGIAYGLGSAFQLKKTSVQDILPFLLLGIGVDDAFVIIQTWDNVGGPAIEGRSVATKISATLKHAGVSILVTSVTDVCAFFIGATTILPGLRSFCVWAGIGIIAVFIYTITFFTALLTLDARRQEARRDACLCCIKLSPEWKPMECSKKSYLQLFIKNVYGPAITSVPGKIVGLLLTAGLLSGGIVGLTHLEQDFDPNLFLPASSAPRQYIDNEKIFFPSHGVISEVYTGGMDYYERYVEMNNIVTTLEQDQYVAEGTIDSWYLNFHVWLNRTYSDQLMQGPTCSTVATDCRAHNETIFYKYLREYLQTDEGQFYQSSIVFDENTGKIKGSSIEFRHVIFENAAEEIKGMDSVQADIKPGVIPSEPNPLLPFVFARPYISWETNKVITEELVRNIILAAACVFIVTLFLLSNLLTSIVVLLCVVIALTNLAGYMHFWGLTIDTVTTIIIVLAIGLTVDYSAHLAHAFMISKKGNKNERMIDALTEIGPAVIHGGMSTFLAFILLAASESYVFLTFFKVFFLVVVFGIFQGLVFLPIVLSLIGPKPYEDYGVEDEEKGKEDLKNHKNPTKQVHIQRMRSLNDVVVVVDAKGAVENKDIEVEY